MAVHLRHPGTRTTVEDISPALALAQSVAILSRILQIQVRLLLVPFGAINWSLNRLAGTANDSLNNSLAPRTAPQTGLPPVLPLVQQTPPTAFADLPRVEILAPSDDEVCENDPEAFRGDRLKLVRWRICFVRHGDESSFPPHEELIADDLAPGVFEAWKSAEFVQSLTDPKKAPEVPEKWLGWLPAACRHANGKLRRLPPGDMKYLRVFFEIIRYSKRERLHFETRQLKVLREIANNLEPRRPIL
jgi:hypothetical protein